ncbi:MAG: hypothetical protein M3Q27_16875 [Actinomycetota bacterium]|nr:hypothetical protein [Actinomycetota bacterium]
MSGWGAQVNVLGWLAIPVVAVVSSMLWVAWVTRVPRPRDRDIDRSVADRARFKAAIEGGVPPVRRPRRRLRRATGTDSPNGPA